MRLAAFLVLSLALAAPARAQETDPPGTTLHGLLDDMLGMVNPWLSDLAEMLGEEHDTIRSVAEELLPLARAASAGALAPADAATLKRLVLEIVERQVAHIQKETMALLPLLDDLLDEDTDRELAFAYACD